MTGRDGAPTPAPRSTRVRSLWAAARVPGQEPPLDTAHLRVYYPASPQDTDTERRTGVIAANLHGAPYPVVRARLQAPGDHSWGSHVLVAGRR